MIHPLRNGGGCCGPDLSTLELRSRTLTGTMVTPREIEREPAATSTTIICSGSVRQRDPSFFGGRGEQDVEDWLAIFERVTTHNNWDDRMKRHNVGFYLNGLAETWYPNHESKTEAWSAFRSRFSEVFGRPAVSKLRAEQRLREREQQPGENFTSYIENGVDLWKRVTSQ